MGLVRWRFDLPHQAAAGVKAPSPSSLWAPARSENSAVERERDRVREAKADWARALVAGAAAPPRETAGGCAISLVFASVTEVGAAGVMDMMGWVTLDATSPGSPNERRRPSAVGGGVDSETRVGGFEDWER
jgi:hypothetical protein